MMTFVIIGLARSGATCILHDAIPDGKGRPPLVESSAARIYHASAAPAAGATRARCLPDLERVRMAAPKLGFSGRQS
jgi:hypothetical protein